MANVLIVDDDHAILDVIEIWLESEGHSIRKMLDGEAALRCLKTEDFDLIITDIIMPKTEGIQVILEIRKSRKNMGIIAISGGSKKGVNYLDAAEKLGADAILAKPLEQSSFIKTVEEVLA